MANTARKRPTKEQSAWMKANGWTSAQMDAFWNDCIETNWKIAALTKAGKSWRDMPLSVVQELPTQKERDLKARAEKEEAERKASEEKAKAIADRKYYEEHFEEIMFHKILSGEKLTEKELQRLVWDYEVERETFEKHRWTQPVASIVCLCERYFEIDWEEGLTEMQEDEYYNQPFEVVARQ